MLLLFSAVLLAGCAIDVEIDHVDLTKVTSGTYHGEYRSGPVKAIVEVEVRDYIITAINLIQHDNLRGGKAEMIINSIQEKQSLEVDGISGATASSNVILKAVELALRQGMQ